MAINVYLSGTTGATDGTLDVQGDGVGLSLTELNAVAVAHLRCPEGQVNAGPIVATAPIDCHASFDGTTYAATATAASGTVGDTNTPIYIKRVANSGNTTPLALSVSITGLTNTTLAPAAPVLGTITVSDVTSTAAVVTFSATDANGDALTYKVAVTTSATPPADWSGYSDTTSPYSATGLTAETAHYAHVLVTDGTLTDVETSEQFTTASAGDSTAPVIAGTLTATPTATQGQVTLSGPTATDNVGISKWQYQVDAGAWVDIASTSGTMPSTTVSGLSVGSHNFAVRALDASSNASTTKTASATVADITAPTISGTLSAVAGDAQVTLSGPTATDNVAIAKWQYQVDGGAWVDVASTSGTFPSTTVSGLSVGSHNFAVRAVDAATNASTTKTASATVFLTYDFTGAAASAPPAVFTVQTAGSGTAALDGSGNLQLYTAATTDGATAGLTDPIPKETHTYKRKFRLTAALDTGYVDALQVSGRATRPPIGPGADSLAFNDFFLGLNTGTPNTVSISYKDAASTQYWWNGSAWITTSTATAEITVNTDYVAILETTATQARLTLKNSTETTTLVQSAWLDWSAIRNNTSNLWLWWGDISSTSRYATTLDDSFSVA